MIECLEFKSSVLGPDYHGSLHATLNLIFSNNNYTSILTQSNHYGSFFFDTEVQNEFKFNHFSNTKSNNFICSALYTIKSQFLLSNFINNSGEIFYYRMYNTNLYAIFNNCNLIDLNFNNLCLNKILYRKRVV